VFLSVFITIGELRSEDDSDLVGSGIAILFFTVFSLMFLWNTYQIFKDIKYKSFIEIDGRIEKKPIGLGYKFRIEFYFVVNYKRYDVGFLNYFKYKKDDNIVLYVSKYSNSVIEII